MIWIMNMVFLFIMRMRGFTFSQTDSTVEKQLNPIVSEMAVNLFMLTSRLLRPWHVVVLKQMMYVHFKKQVRMMLTLVVVCLNIAVKNVNCSIQNIVRKSGGYNEYKNFSEISS